jgi:hypothetical protein
MGYTDSNASDHDGQVDTENLPCIDSETSELDALYDDFFAITTETIADKLAKTTGISAGVQKLDESLPAVDVSKIEIQEDPAKTIAAKSPEYLHPLVAEDWEAYMHGTFGYQAAATVLMSAVIHPATAITVTAANGNTFENTVNGMVIGEGGSGKSRVLDVITPMQYGVSTAVNVKAQLIVNIMVAWNRLCLAVQKNCTDQEVDDIDDLLNSRGYHELVVQYKVLGLIEYSKKAKISTPKFDIPTFVVTKPTIEKLVADGFISTLAFAGLSKFLKIVKVALDFCDSASIRGGECGDVEDAIDEYKKLNPYPTGTHRAIVLDELNTLLRPSLEGGSASAMCSLNQRKIHGSGAKGDRITYGDTKLETHLSVAITGLTTTFNMVSTIRNYPDFIDSGWSGRNIYVPVYRDQVDGDPITTADVRIEDETPVATPENRLIYINAIAGILLATFPDRYSTIRYRAKAEQVVAIFNTKLGMKSAFAASYSESQLNRFEQNAYTLAAQYTIVNAVFDELATLYPLIQGLKFTDGDTGEHTDFGFDKFVDTSFLDSSKWWMDETKTLEFIREIYPIISKIPANPCGLLHDDCTKNALTIVSNSLYAFSHMYDKAQDSDYIKKAAMERAKDNLRATGNTSMRVNDMSEVISGVLAFIGANPGCTDSEIYRKFRGTKFATACFAPGIADRKERMRICAESVSKLIETLIHMKVLNSAIVTTGKTSKKVITIVKQVSEGEIMATAQKLIDDDDN